MEVLHVESSSGTVFSAMIDSGATDHMTPQKSNLEHKSIYKDSRQVHLADDTTLGIDDQRKHMHPSYRLTEYAGITRRHACPRIATKSYFRRKCNDHGIEVSFTADGHVNFSRDGHILAQGIRRNNAYFLEGELRSESLWLDPEVCSASVTPYVSSC